MKIISDKINTNGKRRVLVELDRNEKLIAINEDAHYQLGEPLNDVVGGHIVAAALPAIWCSVEQKWNV